MRTYDMKLKIAVATPKKAKPGKGRQARVGAVECATPAIRSRARECARSARAPNN